MRLPRNLPKIREAVKLKGFVAKVAFHVPQDHFRQKYRREEGSLEQRFDMGFDVVEPSSHRNADALKNIDFEKTLAELPEKTRRVLLLKNDGFKYEEISEKIDLSVSGVKMQVKRGVEQLKILLADVTFLWICATVLLQQCTLI